jgi:hypothetical protein
MVRLACDLCPRRGQHRKDTLIARFGGDVPTFGTSSRNARARTRQARRAACTTRICGNGATDVGLRGPPCGHYSGRLSTVAASIKTSVNIKPPIRTPAHL